MIVVERERLVCIEKRTRESQSSSWRTRALKRGAREKGNLLGGRGAAVAGAEVVDVAHAPLLQRHRRPARRDANDPPPPAALCAHIASKTGLTG